MFFVHTNTHINTHYINYIHQYTHYIDIDIFLSDVRSDRGSFELKKSMFVSPV